MWAIANLLSWPFDETNAVVVAGWSFWLTVVGFPSTLAGLGLAIWQLGRTRTAADAAKAEAVRLRDSLNRFEVGNEAVRASSVLATARNFARNDLWLHAAASYEIVHDSLLVLADEANVFDEAIREKMNRSCAYIKRFCARVEKDRLEGTETINPAKTIAVMSEQRAMLAEVSRIVAKDVVQ